MHILYITVLHTCNIRSTETTKPSLSSRNILCYRLMLGSTLQLRISEEQCKTNSITPASATNPSYQLTMLLSNENRSIDTYYYRRWQLFFRTISKELFGEERHHERLCAILVEYVQINSKHFQQYLSHGSGTIMEHCNNMQKLGVFATQVEIHALAIYIFANSCLHLQ